MNIDLVLFHLRGNIPWLRLLFSEGVLPRTIFITGQVILSYSAQPSDHRGWAYKECLTLHFHFKKLHLLPLIFQIMVKVFY